MAFGRIQIKYVTSHKWLTTSVTPRFEVLGVLPADLEPNSPENPLITRSNLLNKPSHTTNNHELDHLLRSSRKSSVLTSRSKNSNTSSAKRSKSDKNNENGAKESSKQLTVASRNSSRLNSKTRTSSRSKKHSPSTTIGTKNGKKVSFAKTNDTSSTLTFETDGGIKQRHSITNSASRITHNNTNAQKHSEVPLPRNIRTVTLVSSTKKSLRPFNDPFALLSLGIDPTNMFTDSTKFVNFLKEKTNETLFLIISDDLGQSIINDIHSLFYVDSIYILGEAKRKNKSWIQKWYKIKDIYPTVESFCEILKHDIRQHRQDSMTTSTASVELEHLDESFIYTRLLTEILLEMVYDDRTLHAFAQFCRGNLDTSDLKMIDEFEKNYELKGSIWCYTRYSFLYRMINEALRKQDIDIIIKAGFFIRDLQKQIEAQYKLPTEKIILYRGQGLSETDFEQLCRRKGGLYSFNTFLSTSMKRDVGNSFVEGCPQNHELIGVLFQIEIDRNIFTPTQWAFIGTESYFPQEDEFLFAMHSVFRIDEIESIDDRYWKVHLSLTGDNDPELKQITESIREATQGSSGWDRLGKLLLKIRKFSKAKEIFEMLIESTAEDDEASLGHRYHMLGSVYEQGKRDHKNALISYNKALNIYMQCPDSNYLDLITIHNDIGEIYRRTEDYSNALQNFQMALNIHKSRAVNVKLATTYSNMAETYVCLQQHSEALQFYQELLSIQRKAVPQNMTDLCETYSNIGKIYLNMEKTSKALRLFHKVAKYNQRNHSSSTINTAINDTDIGRVHEKLKEYSIALSYYEKALGILSQFYSSNIAELTNTYDNIARVYKNMNENTKALHFYKKAQYNLERTPKLKQPNLGIVYDSMGQIYKNMENIKEATVLHRKAIGFERSTIFPDDFKLQQYRKHLAEARTS